MASTDVWLTFAEDVHAGAYSVWPADPSLLLAAARVQVQFSDQQLGFVDAAVFSVCELMGERKIATLDHRHFGVLRTSDGRPLALLPE